MGSQQSCCEGDYSRKYRDLQDWITVVSRTDDLQGLLDPIEKDERQSKLEPLFRLINMRNGKRVWSLHWSTDDTHLKNLRDPSTRVGFNENKSGISPIKRFIVSNIHDVIDGDFTADDFTPQEYLHALGYDNQFRFDKGDKGFRGDHAMNLRGVGLAVGGLVGAVREAVQRIRDHHDHKVDRIQSLVDGGMTKTRAKIQYNKDLYSLLPHHYVSESDAARMLGIQREESWLIVDGISVSGIAAGIAAVAGIAVATSQMVDVGMMM